MRHECPILPAKAGVLFLMALVVTGIAEEADESAVEVAAAGLDSITKAELFEHVEALADDLLEGRGPGTKGHDLARDLVAKTFADLGLEPAGDKDSYLQEILSVSRRRQTTTVVGANVLGVLPGSDPELAKEFVIVSAHYDHLGVVDGKVMNGADDNASGVAALLELAEAFAGLAPEDRPARSLLFAAWDLEETGLIGSMYWTQHPTKDFKSVAFMLSMDMLSRKFMGLLDGALFVLGTEHSDLVREVVVGLAPEEEQEIVRVGSDLVGSRSDHWFFMDAKVPYLFFTTGTHRHYHQSSDDADSIDQDQLLDSARYVFRAVDQLARAPKRPVFRDPPHREIAEFEQVRGILRRIVEAQERFVPKEGLFEEIKAIEARLDAMIESGKIDEKEREALKVAAGLIVLQLEEK